MGPNKPYKTYKTTTCNKEYNITIRFLHGRQRRYRYGSRDYYYIDYYDIYYYDPNGWPWNAWEIKEPHITHRFPSWKLSSKNKKQWWSRKLKYIGGKYRREDYFEIKW